MDNKSNKIMAFIKDEFWIIVLDMIAVNVAYWLAINARFRPQGREGIAQEFVGGYVIPHGGEQIVKSGIVPPVWRELSAWVRAGMARPFWLSLASGADHGCPAATSLQNDRRSDCSNSYSYIAPAFDSDFLD